jgi:hypothetical protein
MNEKRFLDSKFNECHSIAARCQPQDLAEGAQVRAQRCELYRQSPSMDFKQFSTLGNASK